LVAILYDESFLLFEVNRWSEGETAIDHIFQNK